MITDNLRFNILTTVLAIFIFAWAMMRSLVAGLFVMVPVLAAVILNFAIMGISGITIGWGSSMFTSIAICIGVDYAIHLIYKFQREYSNSGNEQRALMLTLATTGKTILFNAVVVIAGFMVLAGESDAAKSADGSVGICCHVLLICCNIDCTAGADFDSTAKIYIMDYRLKDM